MTLLSIIIAQLLMNALTGKAKLHGQRSDLTAHTHSILGIKMQTQTWSGRMTMSYVSGNRSVDKHAKMT